MKIERGGLLVVFWGVFFNVHVCWVRIGWSTMLIWGYEYLCVTHKPVWRNNQAAGIAARRRHTSHTQAAHLHWVHTSDCTSGVTCSVHDDCSNPSPPRYPPPPKFVFSPKAKKKKNPWHSPSHGEKDGVTADSPLRRGHRVLQGCEQSARDVLLFTVRPRVGSESVGRVWGDADWQFPVLALRLPG